MTLLFLVIFENVQQIITLLKISSTNNIMNKIKNITTYHVINTFNWPNKLRNDWSIENEISFLNLMKAISCIIYSHGLFKAYYNYNIFYSFFFQIMR